MSTTTDLAPTNRAKLRFTAFYAGMAAITSSMVASAPTPIYRVYQETLGLTPLTIALIFAIYSADDGRGVPRRRTANGTTTSKGR